MPFQWPLLGTCSNCPFLLILDHNRLEEIVDPETLMKTQVVELDQFYMCKMCGTKIKRKSHMKRHFRDTHLKAWKYQCPCDRWYNNKSSLYQHLIRHHRDLPRGGVINLDDFLVA